MKMFNKVVIIGTGLIGGSLGLVLKKRRLAGRVIGLSRKHKNAVLAKKIGAIDAIGLSLDAIADADLVILATPVDTIIDIGIKIAKRLKKSCIVIDVGSTKEKIVAKLSRLIPNFIGCHPLAGSEKKGVANFNPDIFKGSICVITPSNKTGIKTLRKVKLFWQKIGAQVILLSPKKHDQVLSFTSHLPHALAFSLIACVPDKFLNLSASGLRDTTRIAASDAGIWSQVFLSNRNNLLAALSSFQKNLKSLEFALKANNQKLLKRMLTAAKHKREKLA